MADDLTFDLYRLLVEEVREAISGNLCRCTGYQPIIDAILQAAQDLRGLKEHAK